MPDPVPHTTRTPGRRTRRDWSTIPPTIELDLVRRHARIRTGPYTAHLVPLRALGQALLDRVPEQEGEIESGHEIRTDRLWVKMAGTRMNVRILLPAMEMNMRIRTESLPTRCVVEHLDHGDVLARVGVPDRIWQFQWDGRNYTAVCMAIAGDDGITDPHHWTAGNVNRTSGSVCWGSTRLPTTLDYGALDRAFLFSQFNADWQSVYSWVESTTTQLRRFVVNNRFMIPPGQSQPDFGPGPDRRVF